MRTCQCCCKMKDGKVIELCGAHDDFVKPMRAVVEAAKQHALHCDQSFLYGLDKALKKLEKRQ